MWHDNLIWWLMVVVLQWQLIMVAVVLKDSSSGRVYSVVKPGSENLALPDYVQFKQLSAHWRGMDIDGFHSIIQAFHWATGPRALQHHAPCWLVNIHITWPFCPPVSMVKDAMESMRSQWYHDYIITATTDTGLYSLGYKRSSADVYTGLPKSKLVASKWL